MASLTVPDEVTFATFTVVTSTSAFPISFAVFEKANLTVLVDGVALTQSDFSFAGTLLEGGGYQGGTVTLNTAVSGVTVRIERNIAPARASNYSPSASVPVRSIDQALNRQMAVTQDLTRKVEDQTGALSASVDSAAASATQANLSAVAAAGSASAAATQAGLATTERVAAEAARDAADADAVATAADRVQTDLDRVQTGLDRDAAAGSAADAVAAMTQAELAAIAAGAAIYSSVANGEAATVNGDLFFVSSAAGVQVYENQSGTGVAIGFLGTVSFPNVAALKAFTGPLTPVGTRIYAGRFRYEVVSSGEHLTTAGSQKLKVLPGEDGFDLEAFGVDLTGVASANTILGVADTAAAAVPCPLVLQNGTISLTSSITVTADLHVKRGGKITFGGGVVLTVEGCFEAGRYEVFIGSLSASVGPRFAGGSVEAIYPEWFGARATGPSGTPVDSAAATQRAFDTASRGGTPGFTYGVSLGQGVYHWATKVTPPVAGLKHLFGQGLQTQVRGMDGGAGFPSVLFELVNGTDNTRISDMTFYGGSSRQVGFGVVANTSMKHTNITNVVFNGFGIACVKSLEWTNLCREVRFENSNVGLWIANVANNNDITLETCRFVSCVVPLVIAPGANVRVNNCQFQGAIAAPHTKTFAYVQGNTCITFANCYFETQFSGGGLAGMTFTTPETTTIFAGIIFNNAPYFTDNVGTVTTTLSRSASAGGRSSCALRECLLGAPAFYAAGAGGAGYTAGSVNVVAVNGSGTGGVGTATVVSGAISAVTITTAGTGYQVGDELDFEQGGNVTATGRVISTTTGNGLLEVSVGGSAAIYPGNIDTLTIENCAMPSSGAVFCLYNDPAVCEPGRVVVRQTPAYSSTTREFFLLGSNTTTLKVPLRDFKIDTLTRVVSTLGATTLNYYPSTFNFTPTVSTFLRQGSRYQGIPSYRLTLNASQQTSDAITGSLAISSSGGNNAELVGRRMVLAVRKLESAANVKLRLTLSVTSGGNTIATQNYDASTAFTKANAAGWEEVSIAIPSNGGTLSWTIEVIASTAASQFVEIIGLPILTMAGVPVEDFPRWLFERPLSNTAVYDPPLLPNGSTTINNFTVNGARLGDLGQIVPPYTVAGVNVTAGGVTSNQIPAVLNNQSGSTVDLASGTWRAYVTPTN